jgi:G:T-mismatch repair DNA endonuclease (very short patch repair protein)
MTQTTSTQGRSTLKECVCGKLFRVYPYQTKRGFGNYCSRACLFASPEYKEKVSKGTKGHRVNREAIGQGQRNLIASGKHNFNPSSQKNATLQKNTDSYKRKRSELARSLWQDPEYVLAQMNARQVKPNKVELRVQGILKKHLPEYEYNGDGRLGIVLAGCVPDYVNVNGQKKVIEIFGGYWHTERAKRWHQSELGRIMAYNSVGFDCLILWETDIRTKSEEDIVQEIEKFDSKEHLKVQVR